MEEINNRDVNDRDYFKSYEDISVHSLMIKDEPRTLAYRNFIQSNPEIFRDKVILDVGAGTGILSLFAASAGAKKVYAIEASRVALICEEVVEINSKSDVIEVIHDAVETTRALDGINVDVIISEWMGFYLMHESMIESVLIARDKWLKPGGLMMPSSATLFACPVNLNQYYFENFEFWKNVYGFDFTPIIPSVLNSVITEPKIMSIESEKLLANHLPIITFDLHLVTASELRTISRTLSFTATKSERLHGFACWFDVTFGDELTRQRFVPNADSLLDENSKVSRIIPANDPVQNGSAGQFHKPVNSAPTGNSNSVSDTKCSHTTSKYKCLTLSTSPHSPATHWKQTVVILPSPLLVEPGHIVTGTFGLEQSLSNKRRYNISIKLDEACLHSDSGDDADEMSDLDTEDHTQPCDCDAPRCRIIKAVMDEYVRQQDNILSDDSVRLSCGEVEEVDKDYETIS